MSTQRDWLGWAALVAALIGTASAEYSLARAAGFGIWVAFAVPAALDVYALRAFKAQRDVPAVVAALILVNSLAHLVSSGHLVVSAPLVIAVSAIAPLVLWRVHALAKPLSAPLAAPVTQEPERATRPAESRTEQPASVPVAAKSDPLLPDARAFADQMRSNAGKSPSLRELQAHLRIGQARAQRIRRALALTA
ncbi:hypothetical protein [Streptomyces plumbiresistens]|uniref:DUF2637 domain-containing protein n=1 Tax=Streptomyces plumbiresistens TaxID=511811 RepID=A0ABP7ST77_9ACTN